MYKQWDPEEARSALDLEMHPVQGRVELGHLELAKHDLEEMVPMAVRALGHLVQFSESEQMRYKAATYVIDKVLGRANDQPMSQKAEDEDALKELVGNSVTYTAG